MFFLAFYFLYLPTVNAAADGPDFFRSKAGLVKLEIYEKPDNQSKQIRVLYAPVSGLQNLGCEGAPSFNEWSKLKNTEKEQAKKDIWCKISYQSTIGWVQNQYLSEDDGALKPTFDCQKATREVEIAICQNQALINLDSQLQNVYQQALFQAGSIGDRPEKAVKELKTTQIGWIKGRNDCWKAQKGMVQCIESNYFERMAYLQAKWVLVSPIKTERYFCNKSRAEFYVSFIPTKPLASVSVEYGDKREIYIAKNKQNNKRFDGEFGAYLELVDNEASLVWDQFKPALTCPRGN